MGQSYIWKVTYEDDDHYYSRAFTNKVKALLYAHDLECRGYYNIDVVKWYGE